jgi:hypothetical protein
MPDVESFRPFEARYTIPAVETIPDEPDEIRRKQRRVRELCAEHNAILLAHHYQRPEVQEVADAVADSLKLSQMAAKDQCLRNCLLRSPLHGRDGSDPVSGQDRAVAGPAVQDARSLPPLPWRNSGSGRQNCQTLSWSPTSTRRLS